MHAAIDQIQPRSSDEIADRARHGNLAGAGGGRDTLPKANLRIHARRLPRHTDLRSIAIQPTRPAYICLNR